jgi:hypothetical protein
MNRMFVSSTLTLVALSSAGGAVLGRVTAVAQDPAARSAPTWAPSGKRERFTPDNCVFAFIDHQTGLMNLVHNERPVEFKSSVIALAKTAKLHAIPTVITTSAESGPNGPFVPEVLELLPDAPVVSRPGQISAWDNADFVAAIRATGRTKIVMAGITTDVCVAVDASGSQSPDVQRAAIVRMSEAGATIGNWFAIACELLADWRNPSGAGTARLLVEHMPSYAEIFNSHAARTSASPAPRKQ